MGDSASRRSTLVSRLPIFRRSTGKRQNSLPSSPSSSNVNGLHTSSPSSTNSSSSSTGKRRSIFRTPSIAFHSKKGSDQKLEPRDQNHDVPNGTQSTENSLQKLDTEVNVKTRGRHSFGFAGSRNKKITRSVTEDFEKEKEHSANRNVFINCLSSGKHEGDDSGFIEEHSKRTTKTSSRKLLPKSFSSHYKLSKQTAHILPVTSVAQSRSSLDAKTSVESEPLTIQSPIPCSIETADSSLQSPLLSTEHTTAPTPSEFLPLTEDSVSEVDALPNHGNTESHAEDFSHHTAASQVYLTPVAISMTSKLSRETCSPHHEACIADVKQSTDILCGALNPPGPPAASQTEPSSLISSDQGKMISIEEHIEPSEPLVTEESQIPDTSHVSVTQQGLLVPQTEGVESVATTIKLSDSEAAKVLTTAKSQSPPKKKGNEVWYSIVTVPRGFSPCQEDKYMERRLRSLSEGTAGSSRINLKLKEGFLEGVNSLRRQRTSSSSSKMNSMDVLNNLGSCELDEDDLMLDLEFSEEPRHHRSVCREDSYQSIASCSAVVLSSTDAKKTEEPKRSENTKRKKSESLIGGEGYQESLLHLETNTQTEHQRDLAPLFLKEADHDDSRYTHVSCMANSPSFDWPFPSLDDSGGLEAMPFMLMMQDCTTLKTLLLKLKRTLQESAEMSPASSIHSLPVSPCTEMPFPLKDFMKDECSMLKLQLKEKDEVISQLREELEKAQSLQKALAFRMDKSTQTEIVGHDILQQ